ncbi:MAG: DUF3048 domain-containing protein [Defluviitaleaceae bacterium]|nr:DUF3048 domain-containing protein [Defluviitaleaceae bacterium]MCL2239116.1 DUF3048 domain-containing protein [Defluviitaleaceae bacterium]
MRFGIIFLAMILLFLAGCVGNEPHYVGAFIEPTPSPTPNPWVTPPPTVAPHEDYEEEDYEEICLLPRSQLTGLLIAEAYANRRPIAVVINNLHGALPQSGIASADIIYEVLVEGDVTRLVAVFQSEWPEKIGPVRSARDYLVDFALNHDGVFIHHGESPNSHLRWPFLNGARIDGGRWETRGFWRDRNYPEWARNSGRRALEHSSYTGGGHIANILESQSIRHYTQDAGGFTFCEDIQEGYAGEALRFTVPFSTHYARTFIFDPETGHYAVAYRHGPTMDEYTAQPVFVRNILVKMTQVRVIANDRAGRRTVATVGEGDGYLFNGGTYRPVRWATQSHTAPLRWYNPDGTPLVLLPGPTWINVLQNTATVRIDT